MSICGFLGFFDKILPTNRPQSKHLVYHIGYPDTVEETNFDTEQNPSKWLSFKIFEGNKDEKLYRRENYFCN